MSIEKMNTSIDHKAEKIQEVLDMSREEEAVLKDEVMWDGKEKWSQTIRSVERKPDGVIHIPYERKNKKYDIMVQYVGKTLQISLSVDGKKMWTLDNIVVWSANDLSQQIGKLLDIYVKDPNRTRIPDKVEKAYQLLQLQWLINQYGLVLKMDKKQLIFKLKFEYGTDPNNWDEYEFTLSKNKDGIYVVEQDKLWIVILGNETYTSKSLKNVLDKVYKAHERSDGSANVHLNTSMDQKLQAVKKVYSGLLE